MRAVLQRVSQASVTVEGKLISEIQTGLLVLLGVEEADTPEDIKWLSKKIVNLRIFSDENELMNKSVVDVNGGIIVVSQFTLFAATKKGNRPSYTRAAKPVIAVPLYESFVEQIEADLENLSEQVSSAPI